MGTVIRDSEGGSKRGKSVFICICLCLKVTTCSQAWTHYCLSIVINRLSENHCNSTYYYNVSWPYMYVISLSIILIDQEDQFTTKYLLYEFK